MSSSWAVPVPLLPDELFSSWLVRAALAQGCDPLVLTGVLWPHCRVWTRDPDRSLSEGLLSTLARVSGIEASTFDAASLRPAASVIALAPLDRLAIWPWTLALGARNRRRHGGLQYCPFCLREDREPYYRVQWRLAWHTGCPRHDVLLLDRCPICNAPVEPHRLPAEVGHLAICGTCRHDLREAGTIALAPEAFAFQRAADEALTAGRGLYGVTRLATCDWFVLSRYFVTLLRKIALHPTAGLASFAKALSVAASLQPPATGLALELLPVGERAALLAGAWAMLDAGPERFLAAAKDVSLTKATLREQRAQVPGLVAALIEELPDERMARTRGTRGGMHKPRSRQSVMRMFARLQRKVLVAIR